MIKVSVMYPKLDGGTFDMEYYTNTHFEIVERTMKPARLEIDAGLDGPYCAVSNLYFESIQSMEAGMGRAAEAQADVVNFTNMTAIVQVSQVVDA